ncbi:cysteine rich repeat-containing protein [Bradyrhizobium roseum]|uniref:cysteine rich repeat-containing protein n=1 Tax=Bradyrhizobium roseum TaxID=3056648 RepID=UPI0026205FE3|nr:cysteine rich repeat-containing protein [Bradyrhizobium roseus]WKA29249.1 cysteine rich repeat-containing protein [Bradyrhizobium roseus]
MRSEAKTLMLVCRSDYDRLCAGVQPGGGRILACLHEHSHQLSAACGQAMPRADALRNSAAAAGAIPK